MLSALVEAIHAFYELRGPEFFVFVILYFWVVWGVKIVLLLCYRPTVGDFHVPVSVVMPAYNEERGVLGKAIGSIRELIKPFADPRVGGAVGDQRIYKSGDNALYWVNAIAESMKYNLTYPALSVFGQVTVLAGRCVAYRRRAVLPLLDGLVHEIFLGRRCVSGDDGRLTSLLLDQGWRAVYQSTSWIETISPPTWRNLIKQQIRWFRNTGRRTLRALLWDRLWVWRRYPLATWQMVTTWTSTLVIGAMLFAILLSVVSHSWFWFGTDASGIALRMALILVSITVTRFIRSFPGLRRHPRRKWFWVLLLPWYGLVLWGVKIYAFFTMNRQGWVTRSVRSGPGGFVGAGAWDRVDRHRLRAADVA